MRVRDEFDDDDEKYLECFEEDLYVEELEEIPISECYEMPDENSKREEDDVTMSLEDSFDTDILSVKEFEYCCKEVEAQKDNPTSVIGMAKALIYAQNEYPKTIIPDFIKALGFLVKNNPGFRTINLVEPKDTLNFELIEKAINQLCECQREIEPDDFTYQFLIIHPFIDGNGRVASLLWNYMRGSILAPEVCSYPFFEDKDENLEK